MEHDQIQEMIDAGLELVGDIGRNNLYIVMRPDYADSLTPLETVGSAPAHVEKAGGTAAAEPYFPGVPYLTVAISKRRLQPGDMLFPTNSKNGTVPIVTILNWDDTKEMVAIRTNRVGRLTKSVKETLFENVYFDFFSTPAPDQPLNPDMLGSLPHDSQKAIMWTRSGVYTGHRLVDTTTGLVYDIQAVHGTGNLLILSLRQGKR